MPVTGPTGAPDAFYLDVLAPLAGPGVAPLSSFPAGGYMTTPAAYTVPLAPVGSSGAYGAGGFGLTDFLGALGQVSGLAFPWVTSYWDQSARMRALEGQEAVGLAHYGFGKAGTYVPAPPPYAFQAAPLAGRSSSNLGGGFDLGGLTSMLPLLVVLLVVFLLLR